METNTESGRGSEVPEAEQLNIQVQEQAHMILQNSTKSIQDQKSGRGSIVGPKKSINIDQSVQTEKTNLESQITTLEDQLIEEATKNNVVKLQNARKTKQIKQLNALLNSLKEQFDTDDVLNIPNLYKASLTHIQLLQEQNKSLQLQTSQLKSIVESKNAIEELNISQKNHQDDHQLLQYSGFLKSENIMLSSKQDTQLKDEFQDKTNSQNDGGSKNNNTCDRGVGTSLVNSKSDQSHEDKIQVLNAKITDLTNVVDRYKLTYGSLSGQQNNSLRSSQVSNVELSESGGDGIHMIHKRKYTDVIELNKKQQLLLEKQKKAKVHELRQKQNGKIKRSTSNQNERKSPASSSLNDDTQLHIKSIEQKEHEIQTSTICNSDNNIQTDELIYENKAIDTDNLITMCQNYTQTDEISQQIAELPKPQSEIIISEEKCVQTKYLKVEQSETQTTIETHDKETQNDELVFSSTETQTECYDYTLIELLSKETQYHNPYPCVKQELSIDQSEQQELEVQQLKLQNANKANDEHQQVNDKQKSNLNITTNVKLNTSTCQTDQIEELDTDIIKSRKTTLINECQKINMLIQDLQNVNQMLTKTDSKQLNTHTSYNQEDNNTTQIQLNIFENQDLSEDASVQQIVQHIVQQIQSLEEQVKQNKQQSTEVIAQYQQVSQDKQVLIKQLEQEGIATSLLKNKLASALDQLNQNKQPEEQAPVEQAYKPTTNEAIIFQEQLKKLNQQKENRSKVNNLANKLEIDRLKNELSQLKDIEHKYKSLVVENTQLRVQNNAYHTILQQKKQ